MFLLLDIDECVVNNLCKNGGMCINIVGSYKCVCGVKYIGRNCEMGMWYFECRFFFFIKF